LSTAAPYAAPGLAAAANIPYFSIKRDVGGIACDATGIGLSRRVMIGRRAFGMMLRGLACEGRRCHERHDQGRDQRSSLHPQIFCGLLVEVVDDVDGDLGAFLYRSDE
jgi:hypothetical protein